MRVTSKFAAISILASVSCSVVAQGVTYDELAAHITKTNPTYQSIELQPKQADLRRNAAVAEDWLFYANSGFRQYSDDRSSSTDDSKYWDNSVGVSRDSQTTGITFDLSYYYSRYRSTYRDIYSPQSYSFYDSSLYAFVNAPLWRNALGYSSRRSLQQSEIRLETDRLSYLSDRQSFMSRTQRQFTALCFIVAAESLTAVAHQRAAALANAAKQHEGSEDGYG